MTRRRVASWLTRRVHEYNTLALWVANAAAYSEIKIRKAAVSITPAKCEFGAERASTGRRKPDIVRVRRPRESLQQHFCVFVLCVRPSWLFCFFVLFSRLPTLLLILYTISSRIRVHDRPPRLRSCLIICIRHYPIESAVKSKLCLGLLADGRGS